MSGVLSRMAKRALGALPTVQPLSASRYSRPAAGLREGSFGLETNVEAEAAAPRAEQQLPNVWKTQVGLTPSAHEQGDQLETPRAPRKARPEANAEDRREHQRASGATPAPAPLAQQRARGEEPNVNIAPRGDVNVAQEFEIADAGLRPSALTTRRAETEPNRDFVGETVTAAKTETEKPALPRPPDRKREAVGAPAVLERKAPPQAWRREAGERAEQKTEIHISIGSIELRAPRTEAKPAAAPFRPRVTLEDFLRRKTEGA